MAIYTLLISLSTINAQRYMLSTSFLFFCLYHILLLLSIQTLDKVTLFYTHNHSTSLGCLESIRNYKNRKTYIFYFG